MDNNTAIDYNPGIIPGVESPASERSLLGLLMNRWEQMGQVNNMLAPDDFFIVRHQWLWKIYQMAYRFNLTADVTVVEDMLAHAGLLDEVGELYLMDMAIHVPSVHNAKSYARMIKEAAGKRTMLEEMSGLAVQLQANAPLEELLDNMQQAVSGLRATFVQQEAATSVQVVDSLLEELAGDTQEVDIGFPKLSALANYQIVRGSYVGILAHPEQGKSRLVTQIAYNAASNGLRVALLSNEATNNQVGKMMARANSTFTWTDHHGHPRRGIPDHILRDNQHGDYDQVYEAMVNSVIALEALPIDWLPNMPISSLMAACHQAQQEGNPFDVVIVDSVNKTDQARSGDGYSAVSAAHAYMLDLALTGPLVIGVSNVNKAGEAKRPTKESPQFRDALYSFRVGIYMHVDQQMQRANNAITTVEMGILKNNNGPKAGQIYLHHDGSSARITEA